MIGWLKREPDRYIGGKENPYLKRWHIIPRNPFFNIYLHQFIRDDDDRALHDHPWPSCSIILTKGYYEHFPLEGTNYQQTYKVVRYPREVVFRGATQAHRIELKRDADDKAVQAWTLFITGPKIRDWGFWCPKGWKIWTEFGDPLNPDEKGPGCDE